MRVNEKTNKLVQTALLACVILVSTMLFKVPIPGTQGYIHLGDGMIFLAVLILGVKYGAIAAMIGSAMGDILGGYAAWAPWTIGIKGMMALILGVFIMQSMKSVSGNMTARHGMQYIGMLFAGLFMTAGYYGAEVIMYGNPMVALLGIPWNIAQFVVGMVVATALSSALCKTSAKKYFAFPCHNS